MIKNMRQSKRKTSGGLRHHQKDDEDKAKPSLPKKKPQKTPLLQRKAPKKRVSKGRRQLSRSSPKKKEVKFQ